MGGNIIETRMGVKVYLACGFLHRLEDIFRNG